MASETHEKGLHLETKVAELLKSVFEYNHKLKTADFDIKLRHTAHVMGVPYEIDVWIETQKSSTPHHSLFVYECKNWKDPVGKAEVSLLADKVDAVGATRGFLVAHRFTEHARQLVKLKSRIQLLECSEEFSNFLQISATRMAWEPLNITLTAQARYEDEMFINEQNLGGVAVQLNGQSLPFPVFQEVILRRFFGEYEQTGSLFSRHHASHFAHFRSLFPYYEGQLLLNQVDIAHLVLDGSFLVYFRPMHLVSKFELKGVGRTCSLVHKDQSFSETDIQIDLLLKG
jgi:Restriction endonuclease